MAASYRKIPVLECQFYFEYYEIFKSTYFEEYLPTAANWEKLKFVQKEFWLYIKIQVFSTSIYQKVHDRYFMIGFPWGLYWHTIFLWCGEKCGDQKFKKRICHVNVLQILTNEKHFPKTISQWEFDFGLFTNLPRIMVARDFFSSSFKLKRGILPLSLDKIRTLTWDLLVILS